MTSSNSHSDDHSSIWRFWTKKVRCNFVKSQNPNSRLIYILIIKVWILKEVLPKKWTSDQLNTFFPRLFPDQQWISTDLEKNGGKKVFNWSEVHFFGSISYEIHILMAFSFDVFHPWCMLWILAPSEKSWNDLLEIRFFFQNSAIFLVIRLSQKNLGLFFESNRRFFSAWRAMNSVMSEGLKIWEVV